MLVSGADQSLIPLQQFFFLAAQTWLSISSELKSSKNDWVLIGSFRGQPKQAAARPFKATVGGDSRRRCHNATGPTVLPQLATKDDGGPILGVFKPNSWKTRSWPETNSRIKYSTPGKLTENWLLQTVCQRHSICGGTCDRYWPSVLQEP